MKKVSFPRVLLFINALVPLALLLWDLFRKHLGANPGEYLTRTTGMLTLVFLMLTLAVTPVRRVFRWNSVIKLRRMLGLFAFFYGFLHLLTYISFDRFFNFRSIPNDVLSRPFITFGMIAFLLMFPLAITSTNKMVKRIGGKQWNRLHKIVYGAGVAGALHFWFFVKSDTRLPLTFAFILLLLLAHRLLVKSYPTEAAISKASVIPHD